MTEEEERRTHDNFGDVAPGQMTTIRECSMHYKQGHLMTKDDNVYYFLELNFLSEVGNDSEDLHSSCMTIKSEHSATYHWKK